MNYYKDQSKKIDEQTWQRYEKTRDVGLRNEILMAYLYIVTCSLKRSQMIAVNRDDMEDLANHGVLEMINCIDRYDYKRGVQFDSFASIRVRGAIIDYLRKKEWVPRDIHQKISLANKMSQQMQNEMGKPPSDSELAERLNMTEAELNRLRVDEMSYHVLALEETLPHGNMSVMDAIEDTTAQTPEHRLLQKDFKNQLAAYIDTLDEKERIVISLYYYEELKLREIAFVLGLTVPRVSQIHSKALSKLKQRITEYMNE
jgi:RNA polymerase sigma factor FliA